MSTNKAIRRAPARAQATSGSTLGEQLAQRATGHRDAAVPAFSPQGEVVDHIDELERESGNVHELLSTLSTRLGVILRPEPPTGDGIDAAAGPLPATAIGELLAARVRELARMRRILSSMLDRLALP